MIINKKTKNPQGVVNLPSSKSVSNRLLILREIANRNLEIKNIAEANDTQILTTILDELYSSNDVIFNFDINNCGTCLRFLTAFLSIRPGIYILTGNKRMQQQRPIAPLVNALRLLNAKISYINKQGFPPLFIKGQSLTGNNVSIDCSLSSQFASALALIAPAFPKGLTITVNNLTSASYLEMTLKLMNKLGLTTEKISDSQYFIPHKQITAQTFVVPADWSSASFWYALIALANKGSILLKDLQKCELQGDTVLWKIYEQLGVKTKFTDKGANIIHSGNKIGRFDMNMNNYPDIAIPLIVNLVLLGVEFRLTGLSNLQHKESNRLQALKNELKKIGATLYVDEYGTVWWNKENIFFPDKITFNTYDDHRIAMSLAQIALFTNIEIIEGQKVVKKSYPFFWQNFNKIFSKTKTI